MKSLLVLMLYAAIPFVAFAIGDLCMAAIMRALPRLTRWMDGLPVNRRRP